MGFNKYSWTCDTERPSRKAVPVSTPTTSTGERLSLLLSILVLKNPCQSSEQKKSQGTLMCICWIASEVTHLSGPLPGRQCSLGILREELAANPLLWRPKGPAHGIIGQQEGPCGCAVTSGAATPRRGCWGLRPSLPFAAS